MERPHGGTLADSPSRGYIPAIPTRARDMIKKLPDDSSCSSHC